MAEKNSLRDSILPSAISAGSGLLGSVFSGIFNARQNKKMQEYDLMKMKMQNQFAHDEAQLARQFQEDMYTKYMDYDSQVKQALDAGVNPNAIIGNAGSSSGGFSPVSASAGTGGVPTQFPEQYADANAFSSIAKSVADLSLLNTQKENIKSVTDKNEAESEGQKILNNVNNKWLDKNMQMQWNKDYATIDQILSTVKVNDVTFDKLKFEFDNILPQVVKLNELDQNKTWIEIQETAQNIANAIKQGKLIEEQQKTEKSKQAANYAGVNVSNQQAFYYNKLGKQIDISNSIMQGKKKIFDATGVDVDGTLVNMLVQLALSEKGDVVLDKLIGTVSSISDKLYKDGVETGNIILDKLNPTIKLGEVPSAVGKGLDWTIKNVMPWPVRFPYQVWSANRQKHKK